MAAAVFPVLNEKPDSARYEVSLEDPSLTQDSEGGYKFSRPRHTRPPRAKWRVSYTSLSDAQTLTLKDFYKLVRGGSLSFDWIEPDSGAVYEVRFVSGINFKYVGYGYTKLWDCSFEVEEL